jgi:hypothetical protein
LISIDLPVGIGIKARNLDGDVRTIQKSLNKVPVLHGGPKEALEVDGKCGPKTNKAINDFQFRQFEFAGTDGVIEPGKQTIIRINQVLFSNLPVNPLANLEIKAKLVSHLDLVARATHAAQTNCMLALGPSGGLDLGRGSANSRLDRHFALNTLPQQTRDKTIRDILGVYNMYTVGAADAWRAGRRGVRRPILRATHASLLLFPTASSARERSTSGAAFRGTGSFWDAALSSR